MCAAFTGNDEVEGLRARVIEAGRMRDEWRVDEWVKEILRVMDPYVKDWSVWPTDVKVRSEFLGEILRENEQLFVIWKISKISEDFIWDKRCLRKQPGDETKEVYLETSLNTFIAS
jgi:hypothetical protein